MSLDRELKKRIDLTLENWGKELIKSVAEALKDKGVTFSGGSESELIGSAELKIGLNDFSAKLMMNDYWVFVDQGRKKGGVSQAGRKKIERWVKRKGKNALSSKPAFDEVFKKKPFDKAVKDITFLIARKLSRVGYKGKFFIEEAITQRLVDSLSEQVLETIEDYTIDQINGD